MASVLNEVTPFATAVVGNGLTCPACAFHDGRVFYEVNKVPAHSVRLVRSFDDAVNCRKGDIRLAHCGSCGFIWNSAFDSALLDYIYTDEYEATQTSSGTFNIFHRALADKLIARYGLTGKEVTEIGCGNGEFLALLHELGVKKATGFDPAWRGSINHPPGVTLIKDWYSERYRELPADMILSKMVMEHVPNPGRFLRMIRNSIGNRKTVTFAMMPDMTRIMKLRAFWDIYYEHCSYFGLGALVHAFRAAGFCVADVWTDFDGQYTAVAALPEVSSNSPRMSEDTPPESVADLLIQQFANDVHQRCRMWRSWIEDRRERKKRVVLWGGGSKGVAFLTTIGILPHQIEFVVDINEKKHGTFICGTGQRIVSPEFLRRYRPDEVVIMSPIYRGEITAALASMGLQPRLRSVEDPRPFRPKA